MTASSLHNPEKIAQSHKYPASYPDICEYSSCCRRTRQVVAWTLGDRSLQSACDLRAALPPGYRRCATRSDLWEAYRAAFPTRTHRCCRKKAGETCHVERWFCTLRQRVSRLVRKALSFSKCAENHLDAIHFFVASYSSRNFSRMMAHVERKCPIWGGEQFHGRIKLRRALPDSLEPSDLEAIAGLLLTSSDKATRLLLVSHALCSEDYVAALESGAMRARFLALQEGRTVGFADVQRMMKESGTFRAEIAAKQPSKKAAPPAPANPLPTRRGLPASERLPLGSLAGVTDFTGIRPPGFLP